MSPAAASITAAESGQSRAASLCCVSAGWCRTKQKDHRLTQTQLGRSLNGVLLSFRAVENAQTCPEPGGYPSEGPFQTENVDNYARVQRILVCPLKTNISSSFKKAYSFDLIHLNLTIVYVYKQ